MLFKILRGPSTRISKDKTEFHDGYAYFTPDDGGFYIDAEDTDTGAQNRIRVNPVMEHQDISGLLNKTGDASNTTATFTAPSARENIKTGEKLSVIMGKIAKWFSSLGTLAFKSSVAKSDLAADVQTSLGKADTVPTKVSELTNDANYITADQAPVQSVNNKTGAVTLSATDVSAIPSTLTGTAGQVLTKTANGQEWKDAAIPQPFTTTPLAPTEAGSVGASMAYARGDHSHPKELPTVSADDNSKILQVVDGQWAATDEANIAPTIGTNGNWYIGGIDSGKPSRGETGAKGATGAKGDTGATGPQGKGLQILGYYATLDALIAAVTSPAAGDAYGVGTAEPYNIYVWDGVGSAWVNNGTAVGVEGNYLAKENPTGTGDLTLLGCNRVTISTYAPEEATGENSFLFGNSEFYAASGKECVAFNGDARANRSFTVGGVVGANADYGFAGPDTSVYGSNSTAFGLLNSVDVAGQTAIGVYCITEAKTKRRLPTYTNREGSWCGKNLFVIGNGTGWSERHNAFEVDWDGNVWAQGRLEGTALILKSNTAGSEKRFVIRVNDEGQLSAQNIDTLNYVMTVNVPSGKTLLAVKDLYTEEEITAISGQENQYPVKYGRSYYVAYQSGRYKLNKLVYNVTDNITVSI